jgi:hypothetical protein
MVNSLLAHAVGLATARLNAAIVRMAIVSLRAALRAQRPIAFGQHEPAVLGICCCRNASR